MEEDEKQGDYLNDNNDAFSSKELKAAVDDILKDVENEEITALGEYQRLSSKNEKLDFQKKCTCVKWDLMEKCTDGTCKKGSITSRIQELKVAYEFPEESLEGKLVTALRLMERETSIKREMKQKKEALHIETKGLIEGLLEEDALRIVEHKWIMPLTKDLNALPETIISDVIAQLEYLSEKYATTFHDVQGEKKSVKKNLVDLVGMLNANGADMEGLKEFKEFLGGRA